jgi:hypothetical protein
MVTSALRPVTEKGTRIASVSGLVVHGGGVLSISASEAAASPSPPPAAHSAVPIVALVAKPVTATPKKLRAAASILRDGPGGEPALDVVTARAKSGRVLVHWSVYRSGAQPRVQAAASRANGRTSRAISNILFKKRALLHFH